MKKSLFTLCFFISGLLGIQAQEQNLNAAGKLLQSDSRLLIGGYGQIDYNQPLAAGTFRSGHLDVHRLVMLFGYKFSERVQFVTEIEFEHVKDVYIEQAFLDYKVNSFLTLRGGLLLVPMGIINIYHEPPTFNGVERPLIDKYIVPTTWREIGIGATGNIIDASLKYEIYVMNGFKSYDNGATLSGSSGLRGGRQKGAESFIFSPNFAGRIEHYGLRGLSIGLSGYKGKTQSDAYEGLSMNDSPAVAAADSSVVNVSMLGLDGRFGMKGWQFRGQLYVAGIGNTQAYNAFTGGDGGMNNLGSGLLGYYLEGAYDLFHLFEKQDTELILFARWEQFDTHWKVEDGTDDNPSYNRSVITTGLGWKMHPGAVFKTDLQLMRSEAETSFSTTLNMGIGLWF